MRPQTTGCRLQAEEGRKNAETQRHRGYFIFFFSLSLCASVFILLSHPVLSGGNERDAKNWRRMEWVDEKGVKHITLLSPRPTKSPASANEQFGPATPAPSREPTQPPMPAIMTARVEKVVSGDTIVLQGNQKLRYVGLRAPAQGEPGYEQALAYHKRLVEGKFINILFDASPRTNDGALLGFVFINQLTFVNAELIRNGYAHANPQPPNIKYQPLFDNLEKRAQSRNLGIWKK